MFAIVFVVAVCCTMWAVCATGHFGLVLAGKRKRQREHEEQRERGRERGRKRWAVGERQQSQQAVNRLPALGQRIL